AACLDHTIKVWHLKTGDVVRLRGHENYVYSVAFSPTDSRLIASASADRTVRLWDLMTRQEVRRFRGTEGIEYGMGNSVTFSPDGRWLAAAGEGGTLHFWEASTGEYRHPLSHQDIKASCVAFSPNGRLLASGNWFGIVQIRDAQTGRLLHTLGDHIWP